MPQGPERDDRTEMSNLTVPQDLGEITPAWLTAALHGKAASSRAAVTGYSAEPIAEGKGFMNQVVRLRLHYDDDPLDLPRTIIAKLPSADPALRMFSNRLGRTGARSGFIRKWRPTPTCKPRTVTTVE